MHQKPAHPDSDLVACEVCLKEIPRSVGHSHEAVDYVHYFCGDACFAEWQTSEPSTPSAQRRAER